MTHGAVRISLCFSATICSTFTAIQTHLLLDREEVDFCRFLRDFLDWLCSLHHRFTVTYDISFRKIIVYMDRTTDENTINNIGKIQ